MDTSAGAGAREYSVFAIAEAQRAVIRTSMTVNRIFRKEVTDLSSIRVPPQERNGRNSGFIRLLLHNRSILTKKLYHTA